jgi:hypothetical protein
MKSPTASFELMCCEVMLRSPDLMRADKTKSFIGEFGVDVVVSSTILREEVWMGLFGKA